MYTPGRSLWWKLMLSFVGLVFVAMLIVLVSVSTLVENRIRADIQQNFEETGRIFERIQEIRYRLLYQTAILLADVPSLKGVMSTGDRATAAAFIRNDLSPLLEFDPLLPDSLLTDELFLNPDSLGLILLLDHNGYPLGQLSGGALPRHSLADRPGIREALEGEYPDRVLIWEQDGRYFNVVTVPVWAGFDLLGTLSLGYPIRQLEAVQLARDTGSEVSYFVDHRLLVTSMRLSEQDSIDWAREIYASTFKVLQNRGAVTTEIARDEENWMVYVASMLPYDRPLRGIPGYYVMGRSLDVALEPLHALQRIIFWLGGFAVLLAGFISAVLTSRINRPIGLLIDGIRRIEDGQYHEPVPVVTRDELSLLTETFNSLVVNLRERLQMLKFVSSATLEAIQKNLSSVEPGGTRKEVTVFFSDVRGFTSWSEKRDPEEVIEMLNSCLRLQADIVKDCGGDVDKFVGDELVAVFEGEKKEANAVEAAIRIQHELADMIGNQPDIAVGVGINSGSVVMGAVGSRDRMDYTVIGNHVNIGARLCSSAAAGQILIARSVYERLERRIEVKELEPVRVKGIEQPVPIYEVVWNGGVS